MDTSQQQVLGDYRLIELVGEGGMAEVYRAQYRGKAGSGPGSPDGEVVLKRIRPALFKQPEFPIFREMFLNEAKLVHGLHHPNLARMHTLGEGLDKSLGIKVPFIVGEYIRGLQLWKLLRTATSGFTGRGVPPAIAAYIIREVSAGLGHAHAYKDPKSGRSQPIIHRDVAPDNIMISTDGRVKVIDFGVAKAIGGFGPQTKTGIIKGKLAYMAPEQVAQKVVPATDVFGAAVILHEMLTGRRLFGGANDFVVVTRVLKAEIPPPSKFLLGIPPELEEVLMKALSRNLKQRYTDGTEFAEALTEVMQRVPELRGVNGDTLKAWSEELQVEAAFRANPPQANVSAEHEAALEPEAPAEAVSSGEIELSGEDVVFAGIADVDPAVRNAVTQSLRAPALDMMHHPSAHPNSEMTQPLTRPSLGMMGGEKPGSHLHHEMTGPLQVPDPQISRSPSAMTPSFDHAGQTFEHLRPIAGGVSSQEVSTNSAVRWLAVAIAVAAIVLVAILILRS